MFDPVEFLNLSPQECDLLVQLKPLFEQQSQLIIDRFYDRILRYPEFQKFLTSEEIISRVKLLQQKYLLGLVNGKYDANYFQERIRIGQAHEQIKLEPRFYLGSYGVLKDILFSVIWEHYQSTPEMAFRFIAALSKVICIDKLLAIESYEDKFNQRERNIAEQNLNRERAEAQENLQHADRLSTIGIFASGIAHEVGTPLNIISGRAEMAMQRLGVDHIAHKDLNIILEQIDRISRIIQNLLDFSRKKEPHFETFDLKEVINKTIEFLHTQIHAKGILLKYKHHDALPLLRGDPDQIEQVLINLIINAIHSMPHGGTIKIESKILAKRAALIIEDSGSGIPPEHLPHIFDPFFTTKKGGEGTGLGLPVCQQLVHNHGGEIEVISEMEKGTSITVYLPLTI